MSYIHLTIVERTALMLEFNKSNFSARKSAKQINRHHSTISRELNKNCSSGHQYSAEQAIEFCQQRRRRGHTKIYLHSLLWKFIVEAIKCLWSPLQISKWLKRQSDDKEMNISHTTIFSTIRALPKGELKKDLLSCLYMENKKRKTENLPQKDSILQDIKTIHERPLGSWKEKYQVIGKIKGKDNKKRSSNFD